jgi:7,8-dihydropterin-6-yl-methyl-4-(beta-D-ribofuranosyl)aminobenzene 5'-phosphate synthase
MFLLRKLVFLLFILFVAAQMPAVQAQGTGVADSVTVTILSSNLADGATIGEWGFSALAEVDGRCVLFDAGRYPDTVIRNAGTLKVDLSCVTDVVLSHFHFDHTTGLAPLLKNLRQLNPNALKRIHVAEGFFFSRRIPSRSGDEEWNQMIALSEELEAGGVEFIQYSGPTEVLPAIWVTGPVKRNYPEKTYPKSIQVNIDGQWVEDYVPDSQGMVIVTPEGPVVLLGCGHSGSVNLLEQVRRTIQDEPAQAIMGGMHLYAADEETLNWTAGKLRDIGVRHLMAGHCTGIEPLMQLRKGLNLDRSTAVVGAVGTRFVYGEGIHPTSIAQ